MKDIEFILQETVRRVPDIKVVQHVKLHPADDDNLWWFRVPSHSKDVQIESADGNCPFWIEKSSMKNSNGGLWLHSVEDVVQAICEYLKA